MSQWFPNLACAAVLIAVPAVTGCRGADARFQQHEEKFQSLSNTAVAVSEAWLAGDVSGTYARAAFERASALVEQERAKLASTPENLADSRGAQLSDSAERLSRLVASLSQDVKRADPASLRRDLEAVRSGTSQR